MPHHALLTPEVVHEIAKRCEKPVTLMAVCRGWFEIAGRVAWLDKFIPLFRLAYRKRMVSLRVQLRV